MGLRRADANAAAMQAYYQRQQDWYWQQQNRNKGRCGLA
jgi:hypothetical protein